MRIFLSGPMGSGKSTLARHLAERLSLPVFDLDAVIEAEQGKSVRAVFESEGEAAFRQLEFACMGQLLERESRGVFALGGGTVTSQALRHRLLGAGLLITLRASVESLARRVGSGVTRPLLTGGDPKERLEALLAQRADAYAECHAQVDTDQGIEGALGEIAALSERNFIAVPLGRRSYRVEVGQGVRARVGELARGRQVVLVTDEHVGPRWGASVTDALTASGCQVTTVSLPPGESAKHVGSLEKIWDQALSAGIDRGSMVIGVGGGVVGDLAGFAAATLLRGIAVGHVPTSLLAMVDSSVGGKTGFDTKHGKNLVGAFHQPSFVLADVEVLATLPDEELRSGLAEVVKSAWIEGEAAVGELERDAPALLARDSAALTRAIHMACRMKARIVTEDERESGVRAYLNLGHTVGHAIEAAVGYVGLRHGEGVALGMVAATRIAQRLGVMEAADAERMLRLIEALALPVDVDRYLEASVLAYMASDKKRAGDSVRYVVPGKPGHIELHSLPLAQLNEWLLG